MKEKPIPNITLTVGGVTTNYSVLSIDLPAIGKEHELETFCIDQAMGANYYSIQGEFKPVKLTFLSRDHTPGNLQKYRCAMIKELTDHGVRTFFGGMVETEWELVSGRVKAVFYPATVDFEIRPVAPVAPELLQGMIDGAVERALDARFAQIGVSPSGVGLKTILDNWERLKQAEEEIKHLDKLADTWMTRAQEADKQSALLNSLLGASELEAKQLAGDVAHWRAEWHKLESKLTDVSLWQAKVADAANKALHLNGCCHWETVCDGIVKLAAGGNGATGGDTAHWKARAELAEKQAQCLQEEVFRLETAKISNHPTYRQERDKARKTYDKLLAELEVWGHKCADIREMEGT